MRQLVRNAPRSSMLTSIPSPFRKQKLKFGEACLVGNELIGEMGQERIPVFMEKAFDDPADRGALECRPRLRYGEGIRASLCALGQKAFSNQIRHDGLHGGVSEGFPARSQDRFDIADGHRRLSGPENLHNSCFEWSKHGAGPVVSEAEEFCSHLPSILADVRPSVKTNPSAVAFTSVPSKPLILFVCRHNTGRSQMAEAFLRKFAGDTVEVASAGTIAANHPDPGVIVAMAEVGIDISKARPKLLNPAIVARAVRIITMGCDVESCDVKLGALRIDEDWKLPDPKGEPPERVREIRDLICRKAHDLAASLKVW
jgi:arsenate reductase